MRDDGSATVLVVAAGAFLSMLAVTVGLVATGLAAHRHAVRAADLAALAGAERSLTDVDAACSTARHVAAANGARLDECRLEAAAVLVRVSVATTGPLPAVAATARAGLALS